MKKIIVTTTINNPTKAIRKFDEMGDWHLIVVGDQKTPPGYRLKNGTYFSPREQELYDQELSDLIGWNCIQRRNFGFLLANDYGAELIATIDDDNIPDDTWGQEVFVGKQVTAPCFETELPCFDPVGATNYPHLWHRGFPPQLLKKRNYGKQSVTTIQVDIQADFWNGDPDIDAICRMEYDPTCTFNPADFPFTSSKPAPFNSQNTFLRPELLPYYFMVPHVGRMDDIWAAYHVQAQGFRVVFHRPSVYQRRNEHSVTEDFKKELLGYTETIKIVTAIANHTYDHGTFWPPKSVAAYKAYRQHFPAAAATAPRQRGRIVPQQA
jgi:hypothetical protein